MKLLILGLFGWFNLIKKYNENKFYPHNHIKFNNLKIIHLLYLPIKNKINGTLNK